MTGKKIAEMLLKAAGDILDQPVAIKNENGVLGYISYFEKKGKEAWLSTYWDEKPITLGELVDFLKDTERVSVGAWDGIVYSPFAVYVGYTEKRKWAEIVVGKTPC